MVHGSLGVGVVDGGTSAYAMTGPPASADQSASASVATGPLGLGSLVCG